MLEIIDPAGNKKAFESALNLDKNTRRGIRAAFFEIGKDLLDTFNKQVLDKSGKSGTIYIRKDRLGRKRRHQASDPGESPANRTGNYRRSAGYQIQGFDRLIFGVTAEHGEWLELGTSRMKPRPGLGNSVNANERNILRAFDLGISERL